MTIAIKWFPPSWIQLNTKDLIIYIDPAYLRTYFTNYPKKIEFSKWPDPIFTIHVTSNLSNCLTF